MVTTGTTAVTVSGITPEGVVTVSRQVIGTTDPADTPAVSCAAESCSVTWHSASPLCLFPTCPYSENNVLAHTDAAGFLRSQVFLTDSPGVTPARSFPAGDGKSVFIYSKATNMFAGRITAEGLVLDAPAVNGGRRIMTSETSFALQPVATVYSGLYFVEPGDSTTGRLYWTGIQPEPAPHVTSLVNLHQSVAFPLALTASARNTYFLYSRGDDDETLMASRLFLRTLASPDPQTSPARRRAVR